MLGVSQEWHHRPVVIIYAQNRSILKDDPLAVPCLYFTITLICCQKQFFSGFRICKLQLNTAHIIVNFFQDIMHDPQVAADGFTYEGEAIQGWLESGHDTSPMTNLKLSHLELTPNHALRLAISDWLCHL